MAIPFFSIDMSGNNWNAYLRGLVNHQGWFGEASNVLESDLGKRFPEHDVILFSSARLGFYFLLKSSFRSGDEVIFSALSFPLYLKIALQIGLIPVLVDVEPEHLNLDPNQLRKAITDKTKAIVVTHLFGNPAEMDVITSIANDCDVPVIEDCAQSYDSYYDGSETGTFGWTGLFSCSLMKVPTTLGGGVLITRDTELASKIRKLAEEQRCLTGAMGQVSYHLKGLVSILNSYPLLYSLLSHQVFGLIRKRNPMLLRRILYAGMGMDDKSFDPAERPRLAAYQLELGAVQFSCAREMTEKRRRNSKIFDAALESHKDVTILKESRKAYWNYQYHVVDLGSRMEEVFDKAFLRGIHVMKEDVWDCTAYNFRGVEQGSCPVATARNSGLLRIPNNSFLSSKISNGIANDLLEILG